MASSSGPPTPHVGASERDERELRLENEILELESSGRFLEAQKKMNELKELRINVGRDKHLEMLEGYDAEKEKMETEMLEEETHMQDAWDEKMKEYDRQAADMLAAAQEKHRKEIEDFANTWHEKYGGKDPKFSSQVLSLRRSLEILVRAKDYVQVAALKTRLEKLEQDELERGVRDSEDRLRKKLSALEMRQRNETKALKQRIDLAHDDLLRQRESDMLRVTQRHSNQLRELSIQRQLDDSRTRNYLQKHKTVISSTPRRTTLDVSCIQKSPESPALKTAMRRGSPTDAGRSTPSRSARDADSAALASSYAPSAESATADSSTDETPVRSVVLDVSDGRKE